MAKIHELKQQLSKAVDELEAMAGKTEAEGFKQDVYEALRDDQIPGLKAQIKRVEEAMNEARLLATPVPGQDRMTPSAPPSAHKLYGSLKSFKDREINGQMVRAVDQAYTAGMWFKAVIFNNEEAIDWCKTRGIAVTKAQGEGVDSMGGFLVPEELLANIIVLRELYGVFRRECTVVPMGSDTLNWPRRVGGLTAYWTAESTTITETEALWDNVNLTAKKLAALTRMSNEISEDAVVSIADWLVGEIAYAFAYAEDQAGFTGTGASAYGGIRGANYQLVNTGTAGLIQTSSATLSSLVAKDFTSVMGNLPQYAIPNAKWYMSQQMFYTAAGAVLAGAGGNKIEDLQAGIRAAAGTTVNLEKPLLLGFPVVISQAMPISAPGSGNVQFLFGDLAKAAALGERRGVIIRRSDHRYFEMDQIGLLGTERLDINVHDVGSSTVAGPLVGGKSP